MAERKYNPETMQELLDDGLIPYEVSKKLGMTSGYIYTLVKRHNLKVKKSGRRLGERKYNPEEVQNLLLKFNAYEVAKKIGMDTTYIYQYIIKNGLKTPHKKRMSENEIEFIEKHCGIDLNTVETAKRLGLCRQAVSIRLKRIEGWYLRPNLDKKMIACLPPVQRGLRERKLKGASPTAEKFVRLCAGCKKGG